MKKPYIICHMMISIDGRIDCAMTSKLPGVDDYYTTLDEINVPTTVSGRVRAELEMAESGEFHAKNTESYGKEGFSKKADATGYEVIIDTNGKLLWPDASGTVSYTHLCFIFVWQISFTCLPHFLCKIENSPCFWPTCIECGMCDHCSNLFLCHTMIFCILKMIF